ncbi:MAG TPA: tetratricopeptide repeat protein [Anaerolineae bacterium]|nr:tetratricopeptide repeat protein [Anaerolineae bacterium]
MQSIDAYSPYETGLRQLLQRMGQEHPRYADALIYQQRLIENITLTRHLGDTDTRKAERTEVIAQLNALALVTLQLSFTDLCDSSLFIPFQAAGDRPTFQNLPSRSDFIGREDAKALVHEALRSRSYLISIDGIGGIGKSSLALEVAYECLNARKNGVTDVKIAIFEGFIWATAKDRDLSLNDLLDIVARTLDNPGIVQNPLEEKRFAVEKLLRKQPYLLIIDNFETINDDTVREFLLNLPEPSKALITTREQKLTRVWTVSLKGLTEAEALMLMRSEGKRLGMHALQVAEDYVLLRLYQATGGIPLAIKWAIGQIKQKGQSLDLVLASLHEATGNIFDHIFGYSWDLLSGDARHVLIVMPLFAAPAAYDAIEATSDVRHFALDEALGQLVEMSLIEASDALEKDTRRYDIHSLTRAFALGKSRQYPEFMKTAYTNLISFIQNLLESYVNSSYVDLAQLRPEFPTIAAAIRHCWANDDLSLGFHMFSNISNFLIVYGYWDEAVALSRQAISLTEQVGQWDYAARFKVWPLSCVLRHRGKLDEAKDLVTEALSVQEQMGDERSFVVTKRNLGRIYQELGHFEQAERLLREALACAERFGVLHSVIMIKVNLATVLLDKNELDAAQALCREAREEAEQWNLMDRTVHTRSLSAEIAFRKGEFAKAKELIDDVMKETREIGRLDFIAFGLYQSGKFKKALGEKEQAKEELEQAKKYYQSLSMPLGVKKAQVLLDEIEEG